MDKDPLRLLTKGEIADILRLRPATIDAMRREGKFPQPLANLGRTLRWKAMDILRHFGLASD